MPPNRPSSLVRERGSRRRTAVREWPDATPAEVTHHDMVKLRTLTLVDGHGVHGLNVGQSWVNLGQPLVIDLAERVVRDFPRS